MKKNLAEPRGTSKNLPEPGVVVVLTFKGTPQGALGCWNGKTWFVWRLTNAGVTGEPTNWHPCEPGLIREWSEIPRGLMVTLHLPRRGSIVASETGPLALLDVEKPYEPVLARYQRRLGASIKPTLDGITVEIKKIGKQLRLARRRNPGFRS